MRTLALTSLAFAVLTVLGLRWWNAGDEDGLPVRVGEPARPARGLVVFVTGDNGIGPIPRALSREAVRRGLRVVVLDSLRYFVAEKPPAQFAHDIEAITARYGNGPDGPLPVVLSGFSFGANALPFAYATLGEALQSRVAGIALISPTRTTLFHSSPLSLLGTIRGTHDVATAIAALPGARTLCIVGVRDTENPCADAALRARLRVVDVPGGHRPDLPPAALATIVLNAFYTAPRPARATSREAPSRHRRRAG